MRILLISITYFAVGILGLIEIRSENIAPEVPWVSVKIRGQRVFEGSKGDFQIKRHVTANEVFFFFRTLGAFDLNQGDIRIARKSGKTSEKLIVFQVCKLVAKGEGETEIELNDGDVLTAYEPEF